MNEDDKKILVTGGCLSHVIMWVLGFLLAVWLLGSCTTTRTVTVTERHTDTLRVTQHQRDSIYVHDSTYVSEQQRGDTILLTTTKWLTKYIERLSHDTIYRARVDSIPAPYPVEVEVPAKLSWWQTFRLHLANILLYLLGITILLTAIRWYRNHR